MSTVVEYDCYGLCIRPAHYVEPFGGAFERYAEMTVGRVAEYANVDAKRDNNLWRVAQLHCPLQREVRKLWVDKWSRRV